MANYQVHFAWGTSGLKQFLPTADVIIWVDVLGDAAFPAISLDPHITPEILRSNLSESFAVADWAVNYQLEQKKRLVIAVIGAGPAENSLEDYLASGAVIERLAQKGIDALSPEAAVANAAFSSLSRAVGHLIASSSNGLAAQVKASDFEIDLDINQANVRKVLL